MNKSIVYVYDGNEFIKDGGEGVTWIFTENRINNSGELFSFQSSEVGEWMDEWMCDEWLKQRN